MARTRNCLAGLPPLGEDLLERPFLFLHKKFFGKNVVLGKKIETVVDNGFSKTKINDSTLCL